MELVLAVLYFCLINYKPKAADECFNQSPNVPVLTLIALYPAIQLQAVFIFVFNLE